MRLGKYWLVHRSAEEMLFWRATTFRLERCALAAAALPALLPLAELILSSCAVVMIIGLGSVHIALELTLLT